MEHILFETDPSRYKHFKLAVDTDLCQGHAVCIGEAPEIFELVEGKVSLKADEARGELCQRVRLAAKYCPTKSILVTDLSEN